VLLFILIHARFIAARIKTPIQVVLCQLDSCDWPPFSRLRKPDGADAGLHRINEA
jgi:hypothetical protein